MLLPMLSLVLCYYFGNPTPFKTQQAVQRTAFDHGITHFILANNYSPPYGEVKHNLGLHMDRNRNTQHNELIISTKSVYDMWPDPYGDHGAAKIVLLALTRASRVLKQYRQSSVTKEACRLNCYEVWPYL